MIDDSTRAETARSARRWSAGAALAAGGLAAGMVLAGTLSANAATTTPSASTSSSTSSTEATDGTGSVGSSMDGSSSDGSSSDGSSSDGSTTGAATAPGSVPASGAAIDPSQPQRPDETLLTGDTATKVTAAALAAYPNATIERVETDSEGVYEAHVVTTAGEHLIVQVGADFSVTGTQSGPGAGHMGGGTGTDPHPDDGDGPGSGVPGGSLPSSPSTGG